MTVVQLSRDLRLHGTVRNVANGDVELMVQGTAEEIETLVTRLREHFGAFVRNLEQRPFRRPIQARRQERIPEFE